LEDLSTELTVVLIVVCALLGTLLTGVSTDRSEIFVIPGVTRHKSRMKGRYICDITTEPDTASHLLAFLGAGISTPFTRLCRLKAVIHAILHFIGQVIDLSERHRISLLNRDALCYRVPIQARVISEGSLKRG
jgi:hypothetical protein